MIADVDALEQRLIAAYRQQLHCYERAMTIVAARLRDADWLARLQEPLDQVAKLDRDMADDKAAWRQNARTPGLELRSIMDQVAEKIRVLKNDVDAEVAALLARRSRLLPEVDDFIRQRWMLNAYGVAKAQG